MSIADNIRNARKDAGLTQKELAKRCTFAEITIRQYETGKREPRSDRLVKIADALGVTVNHLIGYADQDRLMEESGWRIQAFRQAIQNMESGSGLTIDSAADSQLSEQELRLLHLICLLNEEGKSEAVHMLETLARVPEYIHTGRDYND